jgi:hypothetical protein
MATTRRPNPAVAASERAAQISEDMADLAKQANPSVSSLGTRIANKKRATADKIRKEHPYLIETEG